MNNEEKLTAANPDLQGFDLQSLEGVGCWYDGSGGGIQQLAWEMAKLREMQERIDLLRAFVHKHVQVLSRLSWSLNIECIAPKEWQKAKEDVRGFVAQIELHGYTYDKNKVEPRAVAALWPDANWSRSMPAYDHEGDTTRDYVALIEGVVVRIKDAEKVQPVRQVSPFKPCGPLGKFKTEVAA